MPLDNNPLRQYFRRPVIYFRLPSGGVGYKEGTINMPENGEMPVYSMTAADEITVRTPDALFNGVAVVDIIKSCVPNIIDPWAINSIDLEAVLIAIKCASNGNDLEIETTCPGCNDSAKYDINLINVLSTIESGDYDTELTIDDLSFKFRPLSYKEMRDVSQKQNEFQQIVAQINDPTNPDDIETKTSKSQQALKDITDVTMETLATTIEYIKSPTAMVDEQIYIGDFLKNCDKKTFISVRDHNMKLKEQTDLKPLDVQCIHCKHEYKQLFTMNMSDFFE